MALAVNDIVQLTDVQSFLGQQVLNVYFYRVTSFEVGVTLEDIAEVFASATFLGVLTDIQHALLNHDRIIVRNLTNGIDIHEEAIDVPGTATGDSAPSFTAAAFRLIRTNATTRHGQKRIGGIPEGHINGNDLATGIDVTYDTVEVILGSPLERTGTVDEDFELEPVIVGRFPIGGPTPGELDLTVINPVQSAQFIRLTTQTTRRAGRGV